jgi:hypothetical protein
MFYAFSYIEYKDTYKIRNNKQNLVENNYTVPKFHDSYFFLLLSRTQYGRFQDVTDLSLGIIIYSFLCHIFIHWLLLVHKDLLE